MFDSAFPTDIVKHIMCDSMSHIIDLEESIRNRIMKQNSSQVSFVYSSPNDKHKLEVITKNPLHKEVFTAIVTSEHVSRLECLKEVDKYLQNIYDDKTTEYLTYEITWLKKSTERYVSYFYGKDPIEVMNKFYYGKDKNNYTIMKMELMPIS